ncbi:MAG TPA: hypothetical protein PLV87_07205, partial [Opitutaceae bacterium]|nr:hypothetical protein [Opitutaceae bacterium]
MQMRTSLSLPRLRRFEQRVARRRHLAEARADREQQVKSEEARQRRRHVQVRANHGREHAEQEEEHRGREEVGAEHGNFQGVAPAA